MKFNHYIQPATVEEALDWAKRPDAVILGGGMWLHLQNRTVENVVDLSRLGLDQITETEDGISIGAYVTLRQVETSPLLTKYTHGANAAALSPIVGVQFRNTATVGGSVFGRFGFSDVTTLFSALGASVCLAGAGNIPMEQFVRDGAARDVLTHILLPKEVPDGVAALAQRNAATDFPVLTTAVCRRGERVRVSLSPAPLRGYTEDFSINEISRIPDAIADHLTFRADRAASTEYRKHLSRVLIRRALAEQDRGRFSVLRLGANKNADGGQKDREPSPVLPKFKLNHQPVALACAPDTPLINLLRGLGMKSVKCGCENTVCGLCTVLMDGIPVLSCSIPAARVAEKEIMTLEGLRNEAEAFIGFIADQGADQCGFCNPGYVMNTIALLRENPNPTDEEIRAYLAGNLCRCSGYEGQLRGIRAFLDAKKEGQK